MMTKHTAAETFNVKNTRLGVWFLLQNIFHLCNQIESLPSKKKKKEIYFAQQSEDKKNQAIFKIRGHWREI